MVQSVQQRTTGRTTGVRLPARDFSLLQSVKMALGSTQPPIQSAEPLFMGVNWPGCEAHHSPPSNAEDKNGGATSPLRHTSS
jgi:hypothetical protein